MWFEICDSTSKMFDFPDFLLMMRRLLDINFANMNQRLHREPPAGVLNLETLRLPDEASRSAAQSARSTQSSRRRAAARTAAPEAPAIPGSQAGSVYSKAKEVPRTAMDLRSSSWLLAPAMGAAASAASRRAAEALAQRWAFLVAEQGDAEELQALADELHTQTNGQVVPLLRGCQLGCLGKLLDLAGGLEQYAIA
eukprot:g11359.t1